MAARTLLAIETSCDETAAAVLRDGTALLSSVVSSQARIHSAFGGVVPEVASRNHLANVSEVVRQTLADAKLEPSDLDLVAATVGPGLPSALLVGAAAAKGLAIGLNKPFIAVNHVEGHLLSPFFGESIPFHIGLVVSGGHTLLVEVQSAGHYRVLGSTADDAAGEAFDKVAKLLGLGYPGGVEIDRLAAGGDPTSIAFPRAMIHSGDFQFSFSGLKTAVRNFLAKSSARTEDICAAFQEAVVDILVEKSIAAAKSCNLKLIAVSGGVSANRRLQGSLKARCDREGIALRIAPPELRTDNAAMIAFVAWHRWLQGGASALETDIQPSFANFKY